MNGQTLMLPIRIRTITSKNVKINVPYIKGGTTSVLPYFPISVFEIQDIIDEEGPLGILMY